MPRAWLAQNPDEPTDPLFPASHGGRLSRDAVERLLTKHARDAELSCPTLKSKQISPHVLRDTSAMRPRAHDARTRSARRRREPGAGLLNAAQHSPARRECGPTDDDDGGRRPADHLTGCAEAAKMRGLPGGGLDR